ncbi:MULTISPECIES: hypothetical protein [Thermomonas]|uniref:Uncharacterized protein n=2 Tax=Thermomonas TaxID=141948 RepID=A0ABS7TCA4_9GAMM|nr:hypothetical protein [Thermomonas beijingensis]MBZ4185432.1 hypothetical protein [Thermomonas beijingensis]
MLGLSPRHQLMVWLLLAGVGLALFFSGDYRDIPFPVGWFGACLFVAAVWFSVAKLHALPRSEDEAQIAPGEWQAWIGVAFVGAVIVACVMRADAFLPQVPIGHNPEARVAGKHIGTLFVAWLVLLHVLKKRWAGSVLADERDAHIALIAGHWARCITALGIIAIAVTLGFSDTERLLQFSYPFIAQALMSVLLAGLWCEQLAAALLYWRDRRGVQA